MEHENKKIEKEVRDLKAAKIKLTNERNDAITERDNTRRYLNAIEREFSWLKRKTEDEQNNILQLERARNKLSTEYTKQEKKTEHQQNLITELKNMQQSNESMHKEMLSKVHRLMRTIGEQDKDMEILNVKLKEGNARFL